MATMMKSFAASEAPPRRLVSGIGCNARVNLGRRQMLVPQKLLHHSDIRAPVEEVGRETVPQRVGRCFFSLSRVILMYLSMIFRMLLETKAGRQSG